MRRRRSSTGGESCSRPCGLPPIYDRAALRLTAAEAGRAQASGRKPHWRFRLEPTTVRWDDMVRGESHIDGASLSDPVLRREDGRISTLCPRWLTTSILA